MKMMKNAVEEKAYENQGSISADTNAERYDP